jgi:hypothetical protein
MTTTNPKSLIEKEVDRLFAELNAKSGESCRNPITGGGFVWGLDPIATQKKEAVRALLAREWFALNGPAGAPPLPLSHDDVEDYRKARGLAGVVGFYARSLSCRDYDVQEHPSFYDYACGLMAWDTGMWGLENDEDLKKRFPPRSLNGMRSGAIWDPPQQEKTKASYRSRSALSAA